MNKYAAIGLIHEAMKGRSIAVITGIPAETNAALDEFSALLDDAREVRRISRTRDGGSIKFESAGRIEIRTETGGLRGITADVVYLDSGIAHRVDYAEVRADLMPALTPRGEIVRA